MKIKSKNPNNSNRHTISIDYRNVLNPCRGKLLKIKKKFRKITISRQGRHKRFYYPIDFKRRGNDEIIGTVKSRDYCPNRNCFVSLISYENGNFAFILSPEGLEVDDKIISGNDKNVPIKVGNNLPLRYIPKGVKFHNLESKLGEGGKYLRSAGTYGEITGEIFKKGQEYRSVKLVSKEVKLFLADCRATIGKVGNSEANQIVIGNAGRNRWLGVSKTVRGVATNPVDGRGGGGEGKKGKGKVDKIRGKRTRSKKNPSNKFIMRSRHKKIRK